MTEPDPEKVAEQIDELLADLPPEKAAELLEFALTDLITEADPEADEPG